jgi:dienelactone hydrolase
MNEPSHRARVLDWLERHGEVNTTDFMLPGVCDGGTPITRLAARINELRDEGQAIRTVYQPNGTATYVWHGHHEHPEPKPPAPEALFEVASIPRPRRWTEE